MTAASPTREAAAVGAGRRDAHSLAGSEPSKARPLHRPALSGLACRSIAAAPLAADAGALARRMATDPVADALAARAIRLIFVTGYGASGIDRRYDPVRVLQKPVDGRQLAQAIAAGLD